jgi:hypothetical protein
MVRFCSKSKYYKSDYLHTKKAIYRVYVKINRKKERSMNVP